MRIQGNYVRAALSLPQTNTRNTCITLVRNDKLFYKSDLIPDSISIPKSVLVFAILSSQQINANPTWDVYITNAWKSFVVLGFSINTLWHRRSHEKDEWKSLKFTSFLRIDGLSHEIESVLHIHVLYEKYERYRFNYCVTSKIWAFSTGSPQRRNKVYAG